MLYWVHWILSRLFPHFVITGADGTWYMVRYYLLRLRGFRIHLHYILRSDEDPYMHDHLWNFTSIILWEGYTEELPTGVRRIRAGQVVRHRATDAHRLRLDRPAWTLIFATGDKRKWGFRTPHGWLYSRDYFDQKFGRGNYVTGS